MIYGNTPIESMGIIYFPTFAIKFQPFMLPIECLGGDIFEEISETLLDSSPQMVVIVWEFLHFFSSCLGIIGISLVMTLFGEMIQSDEHMFQMGRFNLKPPTR